MIEDDILSAIEADDTSRKAVVAAKEYRFAIDAEEATALIKDNGKRWTILEGVLCKRGAYDCDHADGAVVFVLANDHEYLLPEITAAIIEQLDDATGRLQQDMPTWGMF